MGFRSRDSWATAFDLPLIEILKLLIEENSEFLEDFLTRYPRAQRDFRRLKVRKCVLYWISDLVV
jgi:hypothetical protein